MSSEYRAPAAILASISLAGHRLDAERMSEAERPPSDRHSPARRRCRRGLTLTR
jgi:hypothetical protein